jgi:DNA-binding transcriptional MerR regulator
MAGIACRGLKPRAIWRFSRGEPPMSPSRHNPVQHANAMYLLPDPGHGHRQEFSIGDLSREFSVTLRSLRFYESRGLLKPKRQGMSRIYSRRDRARLKIILMGKSVGFSLREIKEMLDYYDLKDGQITQLRISKGKCESQLLKLEQQREELDVAIKELGRALKIISGLLNDREKGENLGSKPN